MSCPFDPNIADNNLRRWIESGLAQAWVEVQQGRWEHYDWLALLETLEQSSFWPLDPEAVGRVLEGLSREWCNLRCWRKSGQARQWVEAHQGTWSHADWLALLETLSRSEFWPLNPHAVGAVLEDLKRQYWNLRGWQESGQARQWIETRQGTWTHADWLDLLDTLRRSEFWPLDPHAVGAVLEELKRQYENLRVWRESGQAQQWVEAQQGSWTHSEWLALLETLRGSELWPVDPVAVGAVLEELKSAYHNLRRWQESAQPRLWVEARGGRWDHQDWLTLVGDLRRSEFWPLDFNAVGLIVQEVASTALSQAA